MQSTAASIWPKPLADENTKQATTYDRPQQRAPGSDVTPEEQTRHGGGGGGGGRGGERGGK